MDYKNGKIYRMVLDCEDGTSQEYIGSTTSTLVKRLSNHKAGFKQWKDGKGGFIASYDLFMQGDTIIVLIENYPCSCKNELERREREMIETRRRDGFDVVNKNLPAQTYEEFKVYKREYRDSRRDEIKVYNQEYQDSHKEQIKIYQQDYYNIHNEEIKTRSKDYREDHKEQIKVQSQEYRDSHKDEIKLYSQEYRDSHKEQIKARASQPIPCDHCGKIFRKDGMTRHKKSATCLSFKVVLNVVETDKGE
jgi:hypothetical protein